VTTPRTTLRSKAYEQLQEMIVTHALAPGATVTEEELAKRTGIGRTPVREALQRLAREGLVSIRPRSAIVIQEMTVARQMQLLEARAALQEQTVRLAARRADIDQRARMLQLAQAVEDAAVIGDGELYLRISREIHNLLCEAARNEFLQRFMGSLYALSRQFSYTHVREIDIPRAAGTHAAILRAVAALDEEAAAGASRRMMDFLQEFTEGSRRKGGARRRSAAPTSTPAPRIATAAPASAGIRKRAQPATQGERGRRRAAGGR
jgi:DNA-binding GntR family transcriptional regulator